MFRAVPVGTALMMATLCMLAAGGAGTRTGIVRVLYIGEPLYKATPMPHLMQEPLIDVTKVEASTWLGSTTDIMRSMRVYMPRTRDDLVGRYDVVVLSDANVYSFRPQEVVWIGQSVEEDGLGLFMPGGLESFGGVKVGGDWGPTKVGEVLPVFTFPQGADLEDPAVVEIDVWDDPLIRSIPWDTLVSPYNVFIGTNWVAEKPGSVRLASLRRLKDGLRRPFLVYWDIGQGRSVAMSADWTPVAAGNFINWDYYGDYVMALMLYTAQREVPQDYRLLHQVRAEFRAYANKKNTVISMIEFIDRFGASTRPLELDLAGSDRLREDAVRDYIEQRFDDALDRVRQASLSLDEVLESAVKIKNDALMWVYATEWCAVTGACALCGTAIYSLMVKRSAYRQIVTTRLVERGP